MGRKNKPEYNDPSLAALAERGLQHERAYVTFLRDQGKSVIEFTEDSTTEDTIRAMQAGYDVIVQASLSDDHWSGRADILIRNERHSTLGAWSYEVQDTKLAKETKVGTVLQLSVYSEIVASIQDLLPEYFYVVKPGKQFEIEPFRYDDFKAYYQRVKRSLIATIAAGPQPTYPEPVEQCNTCRWWGECNKKRHDDDYLSLIANIRKMHIGEIQKHDIWKLEQFAALDRPLPADPERGTIETFEKLHRQAKIQQEGKGLEIPIYQFLPVVEQQGLNRLPEPDEGDVYLDFEGDPFCNDGGLEYLFGIVFKEKGDYQYKHWWAFTREEEKKAFDEFMTFMMARWETCPGMHIYHYSAYEPSAVKRLGSRHALHEDSVSNMLRAERFVDLYSIAKEAFIASVENYSLKSLEKVAGFVRKCPLEEAGPARRTLEYILEFREHTLIDDFTKLTVRDYNEDDCRATEAFHKWLENERATMLQKGEPLKRPEVSSAEASEKTSANIAARNKLFESIIDGLPSDPTARDEIQQAWWLLAYMVHYHYREDKSHWWTFHTVHDMEPEHLLDEKTAITGLVRHERLLSA